MNKQRQLAEAIAIAVDAHAGQYDQGGHPYILHPLHLMNQFLDDPELAVIAVLHDVVEDGSVSVASLMNAEFSSRVTKVVSFLTRIKGQSYDEYIENICLCRDAVRVKLADLKHNSDTTRLQSIGDKDIERIKKYNKAFLILTWVRAGL